DGAMVFHRPAIKEDAAGGCSGRGPVPRFEPDPGRVPPPSLRARLRQGWASSPPPRPGPMEWTDESRQPMRGLHRGRVRRVVRRLRDAGGGGLAQRRAAVCERLPARAAHRIPDGRGRASPRRAPIAASLGAALATLGLASSFGHFTGMDSTTFWFRLTSVRLQTGIAFAIAGMGLLGAAWRESVAARPVMPRWSPLVVAAAGVTATIVVWQALSADRLASSDSGAP